MAYSVNFVDLHDRRGVVVARAMVDEQDCAELNQWSWCRTGGYAGRRSGRIIVLMHRALVGLEFGDPLQVDHINRDRFDNRRANLRIVTRAQQQQNLPSMGGTSRFRGVSFCRQTGRWRATAVLDGRQHSCGRHIDEETAARAVEAFRRARMPYAEPDVALVLLDEHHVWRSC